MAQVAAFDQAQSPQTETNDIVMQSVGLTKQFGDEIAVQDLTFEIPRGAIFGFIGPSGSGKTTTLRLMAGIYEPTAGDLTVLGTRPKAFTRKHREKIGYMPQLFVLYPDLTVWENLNLVASIYGMGVFRGKRLNQMLDFVELREHKRKLTRNLSGGMQRRLSLATTLAHDPELIFLDEPTASIDPILRVKFWDHFRQLQGEGRTLFVTTQYVGEAAYCDLIGVLAEGRLLMVDTPDGLRRRAFGGDVLDLSATEAIDYTCLQGLRRLPFVRRVAATGDTSLRLVVDEAHEATPRLLEWCKEQNVTVESVQEHLPPFDDVFVELVKRESAHV